MKKPVIGILMRCDEDYETKRPIQYVFESIRRAVIKGGGIPFLICPPKDIDYFYTRGSEFPDFTDEEIDMLNYYIDLCDGIIIPGGYKFTKYDSIIIDMAIKKDMPILGICLGMQALSSYKRTIDNNLVKIESSIDHKRDNKQGYAHEVRIEKDSYLYKIVGEEEIMVNSHHSMMTLPNPNFNITAKAKDGVIEAIEMPNKRFVIGVQWHPEKTVDKDEPSRLIIEELIKQSKSYKNTKKAKVVKI